MHYRADLQASEVQVGSHGSGGNRWTTLPNGFVKVNFDGANAKALRLSGVGVVIRDSYGVVLASCAEKFNQPFKAEDLGCNEGSILRTRARLPKYCS